MNSIEFYKNFETKNIPAFKLFALLGSIFIIYYILIAKGPEGSTPIMAFMILEIILLLISPLYAFVYCFVIQIDVLSRLNGASWANYLPLLGMYAVFFLDTKSLNIIFQDKKLKNLIFVSVLFSLYLLVINIGFKSGFSSQNILQNFGYIFGFFTILPAYYFTLKQPKELFVSLAAVAVVVLSVFFLDLARGYGIFKLEASDRGTESTLERVAGYDIRQFMLCFTYLLPAILVVINIKKFHKYILIAIGLLSYTVIIIALYRLAMFYIAMGIIMSYFFIKKYADTGNILKYFFGLIIMLFLASLFFGQYLTQIQHLFENTINYLTGNRNVQDTSADARFETQYPILTDIIFANFFTGIGLIEIVQMYTFDMYGFVDFPILGTLAAFGFIGMILYYIKFFILLGGTKTDLKNISAEHHDPFVFYLYLTLKAYFITMITFRFFYISWELTFDYLQAEFGLFVGVFLALTKILTEPELT
jgi:hypothetical protein